MNAIKNKIDFAIVIEVNYANPNGDPQNGNRPRVSFDGLGEISDESLKRKIRNRLQDAGEEIIVKTDSRIDDGFRSIRDRVTANEAFVSAETSAEKIKVACDTWIDVRVFGQLFAFSKKKKEQSLNSLTLDVRGPVTMFPAFSLNPVNITSYQITKSTNGETDEKNPDAKSSDTMGMKHRVDHGVYVSYGSINPKLAEKTGLSDDDVVKIKEAIRTMFVNDESAARPAGSMEVRKLIWWEHDCEIGQYSPAAVHRSLQFKELVDEPKRFEDYEMILSPLKDLVPEIIDGM